MNTTDCKDESESDVDGVFRATYDWSTTKPSTGIIETITMTHDGGPTALDPLYDSVDPDALDAFFRLPPEGSDAETATVSFVHAGYDVTAHSDGLVVVRHTE